MVPSNRSRGFSIIEMMVALSGTALFILITFGLLQNSVLSWKRVSGDQTVSTQLLKAEAQLERDLFGASFDEMSVGDGPSSLAGKDGDALWLLSAIDPATGNTVRNLDGTPRFQRNILYYCVVPTGLSVSVTGTGVNDGGYEGSYPYKFLIRKVIDSGTPTVPADPTTQETLLADVTSYLETPTGYTLTSGDSESYSVVARNLTSFEVTRNPALEGITVTVKSANVEEARKQFPIGSRTLLAAPYLIERRFQFFPETRNSVAP